MIDPFLYALATPRQKEYLEATDRLGSGTKAALALGVTKGIVNKSLRGLRKRAASAHKDVRSMMAKTTVQTTPSGAGKKILVLPDVQAKPGTDFSYLMRIGQYMVDKKPDVVVCIGDAADMSSLSGYDRGKKSYEGRRYKKDIEAAHEAMSAFLTPMVDYNAANPEAPYRPRMVLTLGNHEQRISRCIEEDPKLDGAIGLRDLCYEEFGWEVIPFLEVIVIEGVAFSHYFTTGLMGRPASTAAAQLRKTNMSCFAGHQQGKQICYGYRADGSTITSIISGSCYEGQEEYLGPQGNKHWRGFWMLHEVMDGAFDEMPVSLGFINKRYPHLQVARDYAKEQYPEGVR